MSLRAWLRCFVSAGALAWSVGVSVPDSARGQEPAAPAAPGDVPRLPDVDVVAEPPTAPQVNLQPNFEPFSYETLANDNVFSSPPFEGYYGGSSSTGGLINIPDIRFPGTVSVVGKDVIRDQQALRLNDILRDIPGAVQTNSDVNRGDTFFLRGLEMQSYNFRKNGFADPTYTPRDFANVERIDVYKGPSGMIAGGLGLPSGTFNMITRKAVNERFAYGGATVGSWGLQRYTADVNTTNQHGDILYRINTAYENRSSFRDYAYNNRVFVAPTVTWLLSERTALTWEGEYLQDNRRFDSGLIAVGGNARFFDEDTYFGRMDDFQRNHDYRNTLSLVHEISDRWQFFLGGSSIWYDYASKGTVPAFGAGSLANAQGQFVGGTVGRSETSAVNFGESNHALISNVAGEFNTGRITHHTITGVEANWFIANHDRFDTSAGVDPTLTINPFGPYQNGAGDSPSVFSFNNPGYRINRCGLYFQDLVDITERLKLMGGVRWETMHIQYNRELAAGFPLTPVFAAYDEYDICRWVPRAGVLYELVPGALSTYVMYTQSFNPPGGAIFGPGVATLQPELGEIWEGGFKTNIYEDLSLTVSGFHIRRENVTTQLGLATIVQAAEQRSQGVELNLVGNWTDRLRTISNYTYTDVVQEGPAAVAAINGRVRGVPFNLANSWTVYDFIQDREKTFGVGLGWVYVGDRRGDYTSPLVLEAYDRFDLGFFGRIGRWDLSTYVENITNTRYETGSISQFQVYPGAPVNFRFQLGATF